VAIGPFDGVMALVLDCSTGMTTTRRKIVASGQRSPTQGEDRVTAIPDRREHDRHAGFAALAVQPR